MFRLYHSNKLDVLKGVLAHLIKLSPLANPFASEQILVQSPGMAQWLKLELAKEFDICANVNFPLPASFIWQTFVNVLDDVPTRSAFNKDAMAWHIIDLLPQLLDGEEFGELADYLQANEALKLYQLAYKIADIFDQYLVYRPHWIQAWEQGDFSSCRDKRWQGILWKKLFEVITSSGQSHYHRANLYEHLLDALAQRDISDKLPTRIFVFGISALPPKYLQALQMMAQHIDVHFFLNNPCQYYWGDIVDQKWLAKLANRQRQRINHHNYQPEPNTNAQPTSSLDEFSELTVGNPLLASMGKLGRDNLALMVEMEVQEIDIFVPSNSASLLDYLNDDILHLRDGSVIAGADGNSPEEKSRQVIRDDDGSIVIHSCHSPMREVEVLRDQLLAMLAADPSLTPKDIVVMMPDVNAYSPYIQAVFSHSHNYIDFSISDRSAAQESPILLSFMTLLSLSQARKSASELFALLEVPAIMAHFKLSPSHIDDLKRWIDESGIRHGLGEEGAYTNSWQFGLDRMFKGYSQQENDPLNPDAQNLWQGILSYSESVGMAAEQLGQLSYFIELIGRYSERLTGELPFEQWRDLIQQLLTDFYSPSLENDLQLAVIHQALESLEQELSLANFTHTITHAVLVEHLAGKLETGNASQRFLAGKLNFCTLMPMRSIPFKVVCVLGLNDGVYPRTIAPIGFDLMAGQHEKGDRSRRDDDRYLFLEALLSAQQTLYLSYCGRSIKDNSQRGPSVLMNELIDYISQAYRLAADDNCSLEQCRLNMLNKIMHQHPLTPFSALYYNSDPQFYSYQRDWLGALEPNLTTQDFLAEPLPLVLEHQVIEVDLLIRFFKHPSQFFFNQRLGIYFGDSQTDLLDSEPFDPDGLISYGVKSRLLAAYLTDKAQESKDHIRAQGILPHAHFADLYLDDQTQKMSSLATQIKPHLVKMTPDIEVNLPLACQMGTYQLQGWLTQCVEPNRLIRYKSGKLNAKFLVECYVHFLCLCASASEQQSPSAILFTQDGVWQLSAMTAQTAQARLVALADHYLMGLCQPIPLLLQSGWAYINSCFDHKTQMLAEDEKSTFKALKAFQTSFDGGHNMSGESADPYIARSLQQDNFDNLADDIKQSMIDYAVTFLLPIKQLLTEIKSEEPVNE